MALWWTKELKATSAAIRMIQNAALGTRHVQ